MSFESLFIRFWWLIFPIFGMLIALWGMASTERRSRRAMDLIESYVRQGKEPPAELLKIASGADADEGSGGGMTYSRGQASVWSFVTFTAVALGFAVGYQFVQTEKYAFAFLIVAVIMGVLAVGSALILLFGPRPEK